MILNRRGFIASVLLGFALFLCGCAQTPKFYLGTDVSTLTQMDQRGAVYKDHGVRDDAVAIFMRHGWTCFRLRIWVDPRNGVNGLDYTRDLARRIKAAGGTLILDFHYSDTWADPQHQVKPAAWAKLDFDDLVKRTQTYTADVIHTLKEAGACPDMVQIGNEITGGTLWPDAQVKVPASHINVVAGVVRPIKVPEPYDDARQWDHLIRILKAASAGVRQATTPADHVRIIVHIDRGGDWLVTKWYFDHLTSAGVDFDIIGQSYYPIYHGTIQNLRDNLKQTIEYFHRDVMIVETGYPARFRRLVPAQAKNMTWPLTPAGQLQFMKDLIAAAKSAPDGRCIGVNYWHPESTITLRPTTRPNLDVNSLFDAQGNALPAMDVMDGM
jgi:arabinogalactan endo-1,4-beta-galactosidase